MQPVRAARARRVAAFAFVVVALGACALGGTAGSGGAATAPVTVSMTVPSAIASTNSCTSTAATDLGTVLPGASATTATATGATCSFSFSSSNDSAMLRISQRDAIGTAMSRTANPWTPTVFAVGATFSVALKPTTPATAVAFNATGIPITTSNSGTTWTNRAVLAAGYGPTDLAWANDGSNTVWGGGWAKQVVRSTDAGVTWAAPPTLPPFVGTPNVTAVTAPTATTVYLAADNVVYRTTNGGTNWTTLAAGIPAGVIVRDMQARTASTLLVLGNDGRVYRSTNADTTATFTSVALCAGCGGTTITIAPNGTDVYAADGHGITRSTDGGASFTYAYDWRGKAAIRSIFAGSNSSVTAVGNFGLIITSPDGATWTARTSNTLNAAAQVTSSGGTQYIAQSGSSLSASTDGGVTWTQQFGAAQTQRESYDAVDMATQLVGWTVGGNGTISRTTNGAASWTPQTSGTSANLRGVSAATPSVVVAAGDGGVLRRTVDGGTTWGPVTSPTTNTLQSVSMVDATWGWAAGDAGTVLRTGDGGATWRDVSPTITTTSLQSVSGASPTVAWAVGPLGTIVRTTDGGTTWTDQSVGGSAVISSVSAASPTSAVALDTWGNEYRTVNGTSWTNVGNTGDYGLGVDTVGPTATFLLTNSTFQRAYGPATASTLDEYDYADTNAISAVDANEAVAVGEGGSTFTVAGDLPVSDYGGANAWNGASTTNLFGACLQAVGGTATASAWTVDGNGACTTQDTATDPTNHWYALPTTSSKIAETAGAGQVGSVDLVWGVRMKGDQPKGAYRATALVEALAPTA